MLKNVTKNYARAVYVSKHPLCFKGPLCILRVLTILFLSCI
nr:MAG TPA: hypothetical protein [Bacteriophage sp.]